MGDITDRRMKIFINNTDSYFSKTLIKVLREDEIQLQKQQTQQEGGNASGNGFRGYEIVGTLSNDEDAEQSSSVDYIVQKVCCPVIPLPLCCMEFLIVEHDSYSVAISSTASQYSFLVLG